MTPKLVILFSILVTVISDQKKSAENGSCRDYTHNDCSVPDIYKSLKDSNPKKCQQSCQDIIGATCMFWLFDQPHNCCAIYGSQLEAFVEGCSLIGGPPFPQAAQCQSDPCNASKILF